MGTLSSLPFDEHVKIVYYPCEETRIDRIILLEVAFTGVMDYKKTVLEKLKLTQRIIYALSLSLSLSLSA